MQDHNLDQTERDYQLYLEELNGTAARRRTERRLEEEAREREEEWRRHQLKYGGGIPKNYEDE